MPGACVNKLHCRIQSWKITKQLLQSFYHIWFFLSLWPWWTLQKWEVLKGKSHMLALLSTDGDVDGKCSLLTSWYTPALVNVLQWALLPRLEQEGKLSSICSQTMHQPSLVVLKACIWFNAVLWSVLQSKPVSVIQTVNEFKAKSKQCLIFQRY